MTDQHRATTEQWAEQEKWASPPDADPYALCLLELRDRVEALEKARSATVDRMTEQAILGGDMDAAERLIERRRTASEANSLIDRVEARAGGDARAAIREVAAWLREEYPKREGYGTAWANLIEEESNR